MKKDLKIHDDTLPQQNAWGGDIQKGSNTFQYRGLNNRECKPRKVDGEAMGEFRNVSINLSDVEKSQYNPYILDPLSNKSYDELFESVEIWWIRRKRRSPNTVKKRIAIAKRLSQHPLFPIDWFHLSPNQILLYLDYREQVEKAGICAIHNEWDTIKTFCSAFGIDYQRWNYTPPSRLPSKQVIIPLPQMVHKIVHHRYSSDIYQNKLYQYILTFGFTLGLRPSELVILKVSDIFLDDGYIIITEPKKHNQRRQIFPEKDLLVNPRRKSFFNWIESWRPETDNDYLFVQSNGNPYTVSYIRKKLTPLVKVLYPDFHLYMMRHWCAIARLIKSYIERGSWDKTYVKNWLGHDKISTTDGYTQYAESYYRIADYDWIKAILKSPKLWREENSLKSKNDEKTCVSNGTNRSAKERTWRDSNPRPLA